MEESKGFKSDNGGYLWKVKVISEAHLDHWIKDYFGGLEISNQQDGSSVISGELIDMPAVYGLILRLRDAGIVLISLEAERVNNQEYEPQG